MNQRTPISAGAAILWASAFLLAGFVIVQAGRMGGNAAHADMTGSSGDYTLMTTSAGTGDDAAPNEVLYVIDNREQVLLVYEIENAQTRRMFLRDGGSLNNLFRQAGRKP